MSEFSRTLIFKAWVQFSNVISAWRGLIPCSSNLGKDISLLLVFTPLNDKHLWHDLKPIAWKYDPFITDIHISYWQRPLFRVINIPASGPQEAVVTYVNQYVAGYLFPSSHALIYYTPGCASLFLRLLTTTWSPLRPGFHLTYVFRYFRDYLSYNRSAWTTNQPDQGWWRLQFFGRHPHIFLAANKLLTDT